VGCRSGRAAINCPFCPPVSDFICDGPPRPDPGPSEERQFRGFGQFPKSSNTDSRLFDNQHPTLPIPRCAQALSAMRSTAQAIVDSLVRGPHSGVPAGLQWEFYGPMLRRTGRCRTLRPAKARPRLLKAGPNYQGADPKFPTACLSTYYTSTGLATAQVAGRDVGAQSGLNVQNEMREELASDLRGQRPPQNRAGGADGPRHSGLQLSRFPRIVAQPRAARPITAIRAIDQPRR